MTIKKYFSVPNEYFMLTIDWMIGV